MVSHFPRIPKDFDSYPDIKGQLSMLVGMDVEYKVVIGLELWTSKIGLQNYQTYVTLMQIFNPNFLDGLRRPHYDHLWPLHPTNKELQNMLQTINIGWHSMMKL